MIILSIMNNQFPLVRSLTYLLSRAIEMLLVLSRGYGCIINDIARKYKDIDVSDLRKLEKLF